MIGKRWSIVSDLPLELTADALIERGANSKLTAPRLSQASQSFPRFQRIYR